MHTGAELRSFVLQCFNNGISFLLCRHNGLPRWHSVKNPSTNVGDRDAGDMGLIPGSGRSPGVGNGNPLQYSCLGNPRTEEPGGLQSMGITESDTA